MLSANKKTAYTETCIVNKHFFLLFGYYSGRAKILNRKLTHHAHILQPKTFLCWGNSNACFWRRKNIYKRYVIISACVNRSQQDTKNNTQISFRLRACEIMNAKIHDIAEQKYVEIWSIRKRERKISKRVPASHSQFDITKWWEW